MKTYNKSLKPTVLRVTPFAKMANSAPRYGGLVPPLANVPLYSETKFTLFKKISVVNCKSQANVTSSSAFRLNFWNQFAVATTLNSNIHENSSN